MPSTYIPRPDAGVRDWSANFAAVITADPARFHLTPADAATIRSLADDFAVKLRTALEPSTRTTVAVAAKNRSRAAMLSVLRGYAQLIRARRSVSDADKLALGLALNTRTRTRAQSPATAPQLHVRVSAPMTHTLRFTDPAAPTRRARPKGIAGLQLFVSTDPTPPAGPEGATFRRFLRRQDTPIPFTAAEVGRTAYYYARWQNTRGEVGPWSLVTAVTVA